jgi:hypothetical protein
MLAQAVHTPALLGKMPKERGQEHMVPMSTKEGWQVWQTVGLVQVAQVEGQERQSGEERYFPGRHSRHEVMVPAEIVQLTHPTDRDPQEVQAEPQTRYVHPHGAGKTARSIAGGAGRRTVDDLTSNQVG